MTMRRGDRHHWTYLRGHWKEIKTAPGRWKFNYGAVKTQKPHRGVRSGSRYTWKINAVQRAVKTRSGRYKTMMRGTKRLIKARVKGR